MKTLKSILIATIVIMLLPDVNSQSYTKNERGINFFKDKVLSESSKQRSIGTDYSFSVTTGTYRDLIGATSINNNEIWDDPEYVIPIEFNFDLYDITIDSLALGGLGAILYSEIDLNNETGYVIVPFAADLIDRGDISGTSQSPISSKLDGTPGSRILKIEWKNAGFYAELDRFGTLNDFINIQLWLYEGSNDIEFHYGSHKITNPYINYEGETGAIIGLSDYELYNAYLLSGDPNNPVVENDVVFLNGTPADGTIYRFSRNSSSIQSNASREHSIKIYPNPFETETVIQTDILLHDGNLTLYNSLGQIVKQISNISGHQVTLQRDNLTSGLYFIQLTERNQIIGSGKLMIKE
jgi:hypothetical protein